MSLSDRRTFLALVAGLPMAGCGFTPAYGPGGQARGLFDQVTVDAPTDRNSFDLVERLEERLGRSHGARYRLGYRIETRSEGLAIAPDNAIIRYQVIGRIQFSLREIASDRVMSEGEVSSFTAYSAFGTQVTTAATEADANTRLMRLLADQIVTRIIADSAAWNAP